MKRAKKTVNIDEIKNMAANRWHKATQDGEPIAARWQGDTSLFYVRAFSVHEGAFVAGYLAAKRRKGKVKRCRPRSRQ